MSTAIIAHADRDGIAASALILKHREPDARVFPVGRASDVALLLKTCSGPNCPERIYIVGYYCNVPEETWSVLHEQNPRILWFDHHISEWAHRPPPADLVRVFLPRKGRKNAPAAMVAEYLFDGNSVLPAEDREFLARIYEALPPDEIVDFIDGLHAEITGVKYTEMTDFVKAVNARTVPGHYAHFLETARTHQAAFARFLEEEAGAWRMDGHAVLLTVTPGIEAIPRAVLSAWARKATNALVAVLDLGPGRFYVNLRHDVPFDPEEEIRSIPGLRVDYLSGHPYVAFLDQCTLESGASPAEKVFETLSQRMAEFR